MKTQEIKIHTEFIRLQELLKLSGTAQTGGHAKQLIQEGRVSINQIVCTQRRKKLYPGDRATIDHQTELIVI